MIEGFSQSGENYEEAVDCLQYRYNRPCLIYQTHVKMILEAPAVKEGTGKELRKLHDKVQQYLRALKSIESESYGAFITSVLEIKQNVNTMFE